MSSRPGSALYTPELLRLAVSLAHYPFDPASPCAGEARSPTCGSRVAFSGAVRESRVVDPGLRVTACAVGQAAAAIFVAHAAGRSRGQIEAARDAIAQWLARQGPLPAWPGLEALAPAIDYPGRHGAIPLAWNAALAALAALPKETPDS